MVAVSLHQPNFIPWTKLFAKIAASDVYVVYDSVQFTKSEFHNRQRLRSRSGAVLLSIPVRDAKSRPRLCDVQLVNEQDWRGYHLRIIEQEYHRAPFFGEVFPLVEDVYNRSQSLLVDFNLELLSTLCRYLGVEASIVRASTLPHAGDNTDRLIQLTRAVGGDEHVTSTWGTERTYIDWNRVAAAGIAVRTQEFEHPSYPQQFEPFMPDLGVLDLVLSLGPAAVDAVRGSSTFPVVLPGVEHPPSALSLVVG